MDIQKKRAILLASFVSAGFLLIAGQHLRMFLIPAEGGGRHFFEISLLIYFVLLGLARLSQFGIKIGVFDSAKAVSFHHKTAHLAVGCISLAAAVWANQV